MKRVAMVDLAGRHARVARSVEDRVIEVLRSGRYVGGPLLAQLEARVAARCGYAHGVGVGSGTDAVWLALQALGVGPGHEVIVPAVTFFATAGAVMRTGATPVPVDVLPDRPLMDPDAARQAVTPRTRAVVPVHLFGSIAPRPDLGLPVVEDAAQAAGADALGQGAVAAALSFYPTKVLGGAGEGGMVLCDDADLAHSVRRFGVHGVAGPNLHQRVGGAVGTNSRLDAIQAAVLLSGLDDLDARVARRRDIARRYSAALGALVVPWDQTGAVSVFSLRHPSRDALAAALSDASIDSAVYYPRPLGQQPAWAGLPAPPTPQADAFCAQALAIPCHATMSDADVDRVIAAVQDFA